MHLTLGSNGNGPTFEVSILRTTKHTKQCIYNTIYCLTSRVRHLVLVETTVQLCNLHLVLWLLHARFSIHCNQVYAKEGRETEMTFKELGRGEFSGSCCLSTSEVNSRIVVSTHCTNTEQTKFSLEYLHYIWLVL